MQIRRLLKIVEDDSRRLKKVEELDGELWL